MLLPCMGGGGWNEEMKQPFISHYFHFFILHFLFLPDEAERGTGIDCRANKVSVLMNSLEQPQTLAFSLWWLE